MLDALHLTAPLVPARLLNCSDHEGSAEEAQWAALERQEQQRARQQAAEREAREQQLQALEAARAALEAELRRQREPTPVWTSRNELEGWFAAADEVPRHSEADADQAAAAGEEKHWQHQQHQQQAAAGGQAAASGAALGPGDPLPSPLTSATSNFDVAVARLLASAGNTPTGPLGHHRRTGAWAAGAGCGCGGIWSRWAVPAVLASRLSVAHRSPPAPLPLPQPRLAQRRARRWLSRWCCWNQSCLRRWARVSGARAGEEAGAGQHGAQRDAGARQCR